MLRKYVTLDGDVIAETEWAMTSATRCFYCETPLIHNQYTDCKSPGNQDTRHDWITLVTSRQ